MSETTLCFLWRVERQDGFVIRATDHNEPVTFQAETYLPTIGINTTKVVQKLGLGVDNLEVSGALDGELITERDIDAGFYDGATVDIYIVNWQAPDTDPQHKVHGTFGNVFRTELGYTTEIRSQAYILSQETGRTFQRTCDTKLGSLACGINLNQTAYRLQTASVLTSDQGLLTISGADGFDNEWFSLGLLETVEGYKYGIRKHTGTEIDLWAPPSVEIEVGDTVTLFAGCKQDAETCRVKFDNIINFQGFPFMPGNDALSNYPVSGTDNYDGRSLFQ